MCVKLQTLACRGILRQPTDELPFCCNITNFIIWVRRVNYFASAVAVCFSVEKPPIYVGLTLERFFNKKSVASCDHFLWVSPFCTPIMTQSSLHIWTFRMYSRFESTQMKTARITRIFLKKYTINNKKKASDETVTTTARAAREKPIPIENHVLRTLQCYTQM